MRQPHQVQEHVGHLQNGLFAHLGAEAVALLISEPLKVLEQFRRLDH
jgi:hypothetical protein